MRTALLSLCTLFAAPAFGAVVANPGFETGTPVIGGSLNLNWSGDVHNFVTAENGITPAGGAQMLKFIASSSGGPSGAIVSDVIQIVDFTSALDQAVITAGGASVNGSVLFNRVRDTLQPNIVDTQFNFFLRSHATYADAVSLISTNTGSNVLFSDSNLLSWETVNAVLTLPTNTQYVTIHLGMVENVLNDTAGPEFQGHYADEVSLTLVPAPGAAALAGLGALLVARRRR